MDRVRTALLLALGPIRPFFGQLGVTLGLTGFLDRLALLLLLGPKLVLNTAPLFLQLALFFIASRLLLACDLEIIEDDLLERTPLRVARIWVLRCLETRIVGGG